MKTALSLASGLIALGMSLWGGYLTTSVAMRYADRDLSMKDLDRLVFYNPDPELRRRAIIGRRIQMASIVFAIGALFFP